jgi:phosphate starvation-inducible PhoH-like protein
MSKKRYQKEAEEGGFYIKPLRAKNGAQEHYMELLRESEVTFGVGPAGTGKTLLAAYIALEALANGDVSKIIMTRPIVAVEDIGYLPGTMEEKIHPYIVPLLDAIEFHVGPTIAKKLMEESMLEAAPLAFMRGRSLNNAFIILDEAQNTTKEQMRMFLTRLGYGSKMAVNGDGSQSDLPKEAGQNGLAWAVERLRGVEGEITIVEFGSHHIVRNPLIEKILRHLDGPALRREPSFEVDSFLGAEPQARGRKSALTS